MAVQAQHPSNVLFFSRGAQEGKNLLGNDYSLQPQPGGLGFVDQSAMLLMNSGVESNPRKRGRLASTTASAVSPMNQLNAMQTYSPQPINQVQSRQSNVISTGLRLSFAEQQQQNFQKHQQQQSLSSSHSSTLFSLLSEDVSIQFRRQKDEIEHFLKAQGNQLRQTLAEKRQRHFSALLGAAEESISKRLKQKEKEVEEAFQRNVELEARAARLTTEVQVWQARARAQEATAATLQAQLQQAIMSNVWAAGKQQQVTERDDARTQGCSVGEAEDAESVYNDPDRVVVSTGPSCKACRKRVASVVLLPCRHLCLCTQCDSVAQACPLCLTVRSNSLQVLLS